MVRRGHKYSPRINWKIIGDLMEWPAWIQAWTSVVGIGVAFTAIWATLKIAREQRRMATEERRLRARNLALAGYPELLELEAKVIGIRNFWKEIAPSHLAENQFEKLKRGTIKVPPFLSSSLDQLYVLDEQVSTIISQLVSAARIFDRMVEQYVEDLNSGAPFVANQDEMLPLLDNHLDVLETLVKEAEEAIGPSHDAID